jgi:cell fate regulator YaaT (PSP1 superfamily)
MARVQKHTTDPSKITGRCGKLLCCFKYEYTFYKKIDELLPRENVMINSTKGEGIVVDRNLLLQEVTIAKPGGEKIRINVSEIISGQKQENTVCEKNLKDTTWKKIED